MTQQQQLDRRITIQHEVTGSGFGAVTTWEDLDEVWCSFMRPTAQEIYRNESNREQATQTASFRIRYRADVTEDMRIVFDGHNWDIEGILEVGRRDKLDLIATRS